MQSSEETRVDIGLLERMLARDASAVAELYDRHSRLLFGLMLHILGERTQAEEALEDVFVLVWTRAETYDASQGTPRCWLVRMARAHAINRLRARRASDRSAEVPPIAAGATSPDRAHAARQQAANTAFDALPTGQRELLEHAYFFGLTQSELAARFGLPIATVKTRIQTGMRALRQQRQQSPIAQ